MFKSTFSSSLEDIRMSPIVAISEEAKTRATDFEMTGKPFIPFQRGEIDLPTPPYIIDAAIEGMKKGLTKYPKSGGEEFLKEVILDKLKRDYRIHDDLEPDHIIITYGGQEGLELSFKLFSNGAGFSPCWSCALENFVPYAGIPFEEVPLDEDFTVDYDRLRAALRGKDFFYLNNPQNPTGKVFSEEELTKIVELCRERGCHIISDEAYEKIVYDGAEHYSLAKIQHDNVITVFTFSKTYSMTGWRIGYVVCRSDKIARLLRLGNYTQTAGVTTFIQYAAAEALRNGRESEESIRAMVAEFEKRRDALYKGLKSVKGVKLTKPQGAFYIFPNFTELIPVALGGEKRAGYIYNLLMQNGIACVYGSCFGKHFSDNARFSFSATPVPLIEEAVERIKYIFT